MKPIFAKTALVGLAFCTLLSLVTAAPIRVGIFKGTGTSRYWHTSIHTSATAIKNLLANPETANLGPNLIIPANGFSTTEFGVGTGGQASTTMGTPTTAQVTAFIDALDTLDVVWISSFVDIGSCITNTDQRKRLEDFIRTKAFISVHHTIDSYGTWAAWDSLQGARMQNHPSSDRTGTLKMDSLPGNTSDPDFAFLNQGLTDTNFIEEWTSFTRTASVIRSTSGLRVTFTLDESSMSGGAGGMLVMGDHPMSWYRFFSTGGRFFYTAVGHESRNFEGGTTKPRFLRRQLYNAILWAARIDSNGVVAIHPAERRGPETPIKTWVSGNRVHVQVAEETPWRVDIHTLEGKRFASRNGHQAGTVAFNDLRPHTVYLVSIVTPRYRESRRILLE